MPRPPSLTAPPSILFGWLAALVAVPSALLAAAVGQGLGAMAGGCVWIGISLPVGRPVWALVNQPTLDFASRPSALGYWLGSLLLPLAGALAIPVLVSRPRSLASGLAAVELAWGAAVGTAWLAFLDPADGHLTHWLRLQDLPAELVWIAPALAAAATVPITLRLLSVGRATRPHLGRWRRLALVAGYLLLPALAWLGLGCALVGGESLRAAVGLIPPAATALAVAHLYYPPSPARPLRGRRRVGLAWLLAVGLPLIGLLWVAGRPLGGGRWAGLLWSSPDLRNNIRPWVAPQPLPWMASSEVAGQTGNTGQLRGDSSFPGSNGRPADRSSPGGGSQPRPPAAGPRKDGGP